MNKTPKERLANLIKYFKTEKLTEPEFIAYVLAEIIQDPSLSMDAISYEIRKEILKGLEYCANTEDLEAFTAIGPIKFSVEEQRALAPKIIEERRVLGISQD